MDVRGSLEPEVAVRGGSALIGPGSNNEHETADLQPTVRQPDRE